MPERESSQTGDWAGIRFDWLWVYDGEVPVTEIWSKEIPVPLGLFFVLKGRGRIQIGGRKIDLPAGSAFFSGQGLRRQWFARGSRLLSVGFRVSWPDGAPLFSKGLNFARKSAHTRALYAATRRLFGAVHAPRKRLSYTEAVKYLPQSFTDWLRREDAFRRWFGAYAETLGRLGVVPESRLRPHDARLRELIRRLNLWPLDRAFSRGEIVSGLDVGARRMEQLLMAGFGVTPQGYFDNRRDGAARNLLANSSTSIKQIAAMIGLRHAPHFTKWFRRRTGVSPSHYRNGSRDVT